MKQIRFSTVTIAWVFFIPAMGFAHPQDHSVPRSFANGPMALPGETQTQKSAFTYLEPRTHSWISEQGCVSCHTILPYSVGSLTKESVKTSVYQEVLSLVTQRTNAFETSAPWYGDSRALQSKATESVLNAFILTLADIANGAQTPSALTELAFQKLKAQQSENGSWLWLDFELEPWESVSATSYGASLAAVAFARSKNAMNPDYRLTVEKMKHYLHDAYTQSDTSLWAKVSILWAEAELGGILSKDEISSATSEVISKQLPNGGYSMNRFGNWAKVGTQVAAGDLSPDGYASAYVTYVLKKTAASKRASRSVRNLANASYLKGVDWLVKHQNAQGFWESASLVDDDPFNQSLVEDAAAGFALAVFGNY